MRTGRASLNWVGFDSRRALAATAIAAIFAIFLCIATVAGSRGMRVSGSFAPRLNGDLAIAVRGRGLESADAAGAARLRS